MIMNKENKSHPHAELIKAWTNGADIQYWDDDANKWIDCQGYNGFPTWDVELQYRIKPWKPQKYETYYNLFIDRNGEIRICGHIWKNDYTDNALYRQHNVFRDEEEAEAVIPYIEVELKGGIKNVDFEKVWIIENDIVGGLQLTVDELKERLRELSKEYEQLKIINVNLNHKKEVLISNQSEVDGKPITEGEKALIRALRNAKIYDVYPYDNSVIVYKDGEGELITDGYPVAFSIAITAGGQSALLKSLSATCTALNQIQKEQEASNEA